MPRWTARRRGSSPGASPLRRSPRIPELPRTDVNRRPGTRPAGSRGSGSEREPYDRLRLAGRGRRVQHSWVGTTRGARMPSTERPVEPEAARMRTARRHGTGRGGIDPRVFWPALTAVVVVALLAVVFPGTAEDVVLTLQENVVGSFGWYYVLIVAGFVAFALWVGLGRFGDIRLGKDDDVPDYSMATWFSMLFAAGMGIGLVFW